MRFRRILVLGNDHTRHRSPNDIVYTVKWYNREHLLVQWVICQHCRCEWTWGTIAGAGYILPFLVRKHEFSRSPDTSPVAVAPLASVVIFRPCFARHCLSSRYVIFRPRFARCLLPSWYVTFSAALRAVPSPFLVRNFLGSAAHGDGMLR